MDVLVVAGTATPPPHLANKAHIILTVDPSAASATLVADLRSHVPSRVGVLGEGPAAAGVANTIHEAGLPVVLYTDHPDDVLEDGIEVVPVTDAGPPMDVADSLLDLVGSTPLVRLDRMGRDLDCHLLAKLELLNPGGSVKDRPALRMVEQAEADGRLGRGGVIVEPTSGNTGVGLAIVAARRGYRCIFVMPDKMSDEKISLLRAYGAEVVVCPTAVPPDHPESYYSVADRLTNETPGGFQPGQYHNPENPKSHALTTGPEIWEQTAGRVTHFVAGIGTGGTISGVGQSLKSYNRDIRIIGADPIGSVYSGGGGRPYMVEGIGEDFWPTTYDRDVVDEVVAVSDRDSFLTARRITREEGILAGGSAGTAVWAAVHVARSLPHDAVVVTLIPDSGKGYISKIYNDEWMAHHGFLRVVGDTVGDVLEHKRSDLPALVHTHPDETVREAIAILREFEVSQMPVVAAEPPVVFGEVAGSVRDRDLLDLAFSDPGALDKTVGSVMGPPLPTVGSGEPVNYAVARLEDASAVLVVDAGNPVGVLTRSDLLEYIARRDGGAR